MHEMGIANSVIDAVRSEAARYPGAKPCKVGLRVGALAAVDPESLRFCFEALTKDTDLESLALEIIFCPQRHRCRDCGGEFDVVEYRLDCPQCGGNQTEFIGGDELKMEYLEIEDHEPSPA